jgi:hypothetical protein
MPIHVLKVEKDEKGGWIFDMVLEWVHEYVKGRDYAVLVTDENEIILEPRKSTRPLDYGYVCLDDSAAVRELAEKIARTYNLPLLEIQYFRWDIERPPSVKVPIE